MNFEKALKFLKDLSKNNNREWFEKNKSRFTECKDEFEGFVSVLLDDMIQFDSSLAGLNPKKLIFRIYRDVRFSKDKTPYKKNFSAGFSAEGKGMGTPGYYFHIQPNGESFVAAGLFQPVPENLAKIRQEIDYNGDQLKKIFNEKKFKANYKKFWDEDKLKTAPKGYDKDHSYVEWLKLKSFIVIHSFKDAEVTSRNFRKNVVQVLKSSKPLNDFLKEAIS
ncbi:MAG TPA: DUF2461 domain-containing protein [Chryseolinea sp.]